MISRVLLYFNVVVDAFLYSIYATETAGVQCPMLWRTSVTTPHINARASTDNQPARVTADFCYPIITITELCSCLLSIVSQSLPVPV